MKPALRRSITFWSGILVMVFICWAWLDSMNHLSAWHWYPSPTRAVGVRHVAGAIDCGDLTMIPQAATLYAGMNPAGLHRESVNCRVDSVADLLRLPKLLPRREIAVVEDTARMESVELIIPHWLLLVATALSWYLLLIWRARRRKRAAAIGA